ncbi:MAG: HEPN domain-containing protein [Candidatus Brockarchaeota archaeon]|nr:HEPN domain-containing protein [Candidatus Brockarchaeota archaeon]
MKDAEEAFRRSDWRIVVASSQSCAENAAKGVIAFFKVPSWSHDPSSELIDILSSIPSNVKKLGEGLVSIVRALAPEHGRSTYGEPTRGLTPWDIYSAADAERALGMAREALENAVMILKGLGVEV